MDTPGPIYATNYARVSNILKRKYSAASFGSANVQDSSLIHFLVELEGRVEAVSLKKTLHFSSKNCTFNSVS